MLSAVDFCHLLLRDRLQAGDWALDATAGNGHDTLFLAQTVGAEGRVFACDLQPAAVAATQALLAERGISPGSWEFFTACHSTLSDLLPPEARGRLAAAIFNLGYLPGGDKSLITQARNTLRAVEGIWEILRPGGLLLIVLYPGHEGGAEEAAQLRAWAAGLPAASGHAAEFQTLNAKNPAPSVLVIHKSARRRPAS